MFLGSTPPVISQYIFKVLRSLSQKPQRIFIPFSGNLVIEQIVNQAIPGVEVISTDVSIYSRAIGFGINDVDFQLELKDEFQDDFKFLSTKKEPLEKAAVAVMFSEIGNAWLKKDRIHYYKKQYTDAIQNQVKYFKEVMDKLTRLRAEVNFKFLGVDACKVLEMVEAEDFVFYDPPYWVSGYKNMFKGLEECLIFEEVEYTDITDEVKDNQLRVLDKKNAMVLFRTIANYQNVNYKLVYHFQYKPNLAYLIYSNFECTCFVGRSEYIKEEVRNIKIISEVDEITERSQPQIIHTTAPIANHYRFMWCKKAQMTNCAYNFLVFIDEKLIGVLGLSDGQHFSIEYITIFYDTTSPTSKYMRLSKLILFLCCTKEMIKIINDASMWEHMGFTTRVFTNNPVSMKYRGLFKLAKREADRDSNFKYKLIYQNKEKILDSFRDGLIAWVNKYGRQVK